MRLILFAALLLVLAGCSAAGRIPSARVTPADADVTFRAKSGPVSVNPDHTDAQIREELEGAVEVNGVNIDDRVCRLIAECPTMLVLHIYRYWIGSGPPQGKLTDAGLQALARNTHVQLITINEESRITDTGVKSLYQDDRMLYVYLYNCWSVSEDLPASNTSCTRVVVDNSPEPPDPTDNQETELPDE
ncbi:MAG: hypothetical protein KDB82_12680 [Planctomycetes bacterium]|nr:hypothetical protein [Planctomycetota bacterium]